MAELAADCYTDIARRLREIRGEIPVAPQEPMKVETTQSASEEDELLAQILLSGGF